MIHLAFNITNPWSRRLIKSLKSWHGSTPWENKFWELDITRSRTVVSVNLVVNHRSSHAGVDIVLGLFGHDLMFSFYDRRHWDYETDTWENQDDKKDILRKAG